MGDDDGSQGNGSCSQGVPTVPVDGPGGPKGSWVGAVQSNRVLKKYDVEILMKDGVGRISLLESFSMMLPILRRFMP